MRNVRHVELDRCVSLVTMFGLDRHVDKQTFLSNLPNEIPARMGDAIANVRLLGPRLLGIMLDCCSTKILHTVYELENISFAMILWQDKRIDTYMFLLVKHTMSIAE